MTDNKLADYVLVPRVPTPEMDAAGKGALNDNGVGDLDDSDALICYAAMIAAAPDAPAPVQGKADGDALNTVMREVEKIWKVATPFVDSLETMGELMHAKSRLNAAIAALQQPGTPALPEVSEGFYLASFKGPLRDEVLWWGENNRGYTTDLSEAGVYTEIKPNYHDSEHTVPVPVAFVGAQHTRRVLSRAYQGNTSWRSADTLRKEIESYRARLMTKGVQS